MAQPDEVYPEILLDVDIRDYNPGERHDFSALAAKFLALREPLRKLAQEDPANLDRYENYFRLPAREILTKAYARDESNAYNYLKKIKADTAQDNPAEFYYRIAEEADKLKADIAKYEAIQKDNPNVIVLDSIADLNEALNELLRIAPRKFEGEEYISYRVLKNFNKSSHFRRDIFVEIKPDNIVYNLPEEGEPIEYLTEYFKQAEIPRVLREKGLRPNQDEIFDEDNYDGMDPVYAEIDEVKEFNDQAQLGVISDDDTSFLKIIGYKSEAHNFEEVKKKKGVFREADKLDIPFIDIVPRDYEYVSISLSEKMQLVDRLQLKVFYWQVVKILNELRDREWRFSGVVFTFEGTTQLDDGTFVISSKQLTCSIRYLVEFDSFFIWVLTVMLKEVQYTGISYSVLKMDHFTIWQSRDNNKSFKEVLGGKVKTIFEFEPSQDGYCVAEFMRAIGIDITNEDFDEHNEQCKATGRHPLTVWNEVLTMLYDEDIKKKPYIIHRGLEIDFGEFDRKLPARHAEVYAGKKLYKLTDKLIKMQTEVEKDNPIVNAFLIFNNCECVDECFCSGHIGIIKGIKSNLYVDESKTVYEKSVDPVKFTVLLRNGETYSIVDPKLAKKPKFEYKEMNLYFDCETVSEKYNAKAYSLSASFLTVAQTKELSDLDNKIGELRGKIAKMSIMSVKNYKSIAKYEKCFESKCDAVCDEERKQKAIAGKYGKLKKQAELISQAQVIDVDGKTDAEDLYTIEDVSELAKQIQTCKDRIEVIIKLSTKFWMGFDCIEKLYNEMIKYTDVKFNIIGYNNTNFDNLLLTRQLNTIDTTCVSDVFWVGSKMLTATIMGRHKIFDLWKHTGGSLKASCEAFKVNYLSKDAFSHEDAQREYNNNRNGFFEWLSKTNIEKYNNMDVISLAIVHHRYVDGMKKIAPDLSIKGESRETDPTKFLTLGSYAQKELDLAWKKKKIHVAPYGNANYCKVNKAYTDYSQWHYDFVNKYLNLGLPNRPTKDDLARANDEYFRLEVALYKTIYASRQGGRCSIVRPRHVPECKPNSRISADITSMYPYAYMIYKCYFGAGDIQFINSEDEVPLHDHRAPCTCHIDDKFHGQKMVSFFLCDIDMMDIKDPCLRIRASRTKDGNDWVTPCGQMDQMVSSAMIKTLREMGCKVTTKWGFYRTEKIRNIDLFSHLLEYKAEKDRQDVLKDLGSAEYNPVQRTCAKAVMNIISGKASEDIHNEEVEEVSFEDLHIYQEKYNVEVLQDRGDRIVIRYKVDKYSQKKMKTSRAVDHAVLIYDYSKIYMHESLTKHIKWDITDTDSAHVDREDMEKFLASPAGQQKVPHWPEVAEKDKNYIGHKTYDEEKNNVFGSYEDELEGKYFNGFIYAAKKMYIYRRAHEGVLQKMYLNTKGELCEDKGYKVSSKGLSKQAKYIRQEDLENVKKQLNTPDSIQNFNAFCSYKSKTFAEDPWPFYEDLALHGRTSFMQMVMLKSSCDKKDTQYSNIQIKYIVKTITQKKIESESAIITDQHALTCDEAAQHVLQGQ